MSEEKDIAAESPSSKKSASRQRPPVKKLKKEEAKAETKTKPANTELALSLESKIDEIIHEIEGKPLKSLERNNREKLIQSYERLIFTLVREINNSRQ